MYRFFKNKENKIIIYKRAYVMYLQSDGSEFFFMIQKSLYYV